MKLHASRDDRDLDDAALLFSRLGYTSAQECIDMLTATYPTGQLLPRHRYIAEEVATRAHARRDARATDAVKRREQAINDGFDPFQNPWQEHSGPGRHNPGRNL